MIELAEDDLEDGVEERNVMVYLNGREKPSFRCGCHGNVFTRLTPTFEGLVRYRCNSCSQEYEAE